MITGTYSDVIVEAVSDGNVVRITDKGVSRDGDVHVLTELLMVRLEQLPEGLSVRNHLQLSVFSQGTRYLGL